MKTPDYTDVTEAAKRIEGQAVRTPLVRSDALDQRSGAEVFFKPECLQVTGSFKFRGAYNAISALSPEERERGIVANSSGNHAQGVAEAARRFGARATIVMPSDAPAIKVARTRRSGAEIVFFDRATDDREVAMQEVLEARGGVPVHPFNNPMVIAGQGTTGLEIASDFKHMGRTLDRVLVCTGGGGLTAGVTLAVDHHFPEAKIHPVEPVGFDDYARSLQAGEPVANERTAGSICDALLTQVPGEIGFAINRERLSEGFQVSDEEALKAMRIAFEELKLVLEPGGAVALAALLACGTQFKGETVAVVISGGNADPAIFERALAA